MHGDLSIGCKTIKRLAKGQREVSFILMMLLLLLPVLIRPPLTAITYPFVVIYPPTQAGGLITVKGYVGFRCPPGQPWQYHVQVNWEHGGVVVFQNNSAEITPFKETGGGNYEYNFSDARVLGSGGEWIIRVRIYHSRPPGKDGQAEAVEKIIVTTFSVKVTTEPEGLNICVDGVTYSSPQTFAWLSGSEHTVGTFSPQPYGNAICEWVSWSDGGDMNHTVTATENATYTAYFSVKFKYLLTVETDPKGLVTIPGEGWYDENTYVTLTAPDIVPVSTGVRYRFSHWDVDGESQDSVNPITVTMDAPHIATAHYVLQYYLSVTSLYDTPNPESGWFDAGTEITATVASPWPVDATDTRHISTGWTGTGSVPPSGTDTSVTFTINEPSNITWNWKTQHYVAFTQTGIGDDFTGDVLTIDGVGYGRDGYAAWYDEGASIVFNYESPLIAADSQKRYFLTSVDASSPLTVSGPMTIMGSYKTQYLVTFNQIGLDRTAVGTVVSIDGSSKTYDDLPFAMWVDSGASVSYSYETIVSSSVEGKRYRFDNATGPPSPYVVSEMCTVTGHYVAQLQVVLAVNPPDAGVTDPSGENWYDSGSQISISASANPGYAFSGWSVNTPLITITDASSQSTTAIINGQGQVTASFTLLYAVSFTQTGLPSGTEWSITFNDVTKTSTLNTIVFSDVPQGEYSWSASTPIPGDPGTRYVASPSSGAMNVPSQLSQAIAYSAQYRVIFYMNPASGTITVGGVVRNNGESEFYDDGASLTIVANAPVGYGFSSWTVTGGVTVEDYSVQTTSMKVDEAGSLTANFVIDTVLILITSSPVTGVGFVKVDGVSYATPVSFSWVIGSTHELEAIPTVPGPTGTRYVWMRWSDGGARLHAYTVPGESEIVTAYFSVQHYLTVVSPHDTPGGSGWYDEGSTAYATLETGVVAESGVQYVFTGWSGDASGTGLISNPITMSRPKTAIANWASGLYTVTFNKSPRQGIITIDGTVYTSLPVMLQWVPGSSHEVVVPEIEESEGTRYVFRAWSDGSTLASRIIVANTPGAVYIAYYNTQHRLLVHSEFGTTTGSGWYDEGAEATFSVSPTVVRDESRGIEFTFKGWVGSGTGVYYTGPDNPAKVVMTGPVEEFAQWEPTMYYLKVISEYGEPYGSGWYTSNSEASFGVTTPVNHGNRTIRVFVNWSGDVDLGEPTGTIIMVKPSIVNASWDTQYLVVYNTTAPNGVLLSIPRVPQILPPGFDVFALYYSAGSSVEVGPAPETVYEAEGIRYCFKGWAINGKPVTPNANLTFTVDRPLNISVIYGTELLLVVNVIGVDQPYTVKLTVVSSPASVFDVTPTSPFKKWLRKGIDVALTVSSPNKIGHGEWAVFKEWSGDARENQRAVSLVVLTPVTLNAVFFAVNPVAESIPYSLLAGIVSTVSSRLIRKRREEEYQGRSHCSLTLGIVSLTVVLAMAAIASSHVAMGYGIDVRELPDFTNWAVVFTAAEAIAFLTMTIIVTRLAYPRRLEIPGIYLNPYGI